LEDLHMMSRLYLSALAVGLTLTAVGCGKDAPAAPTPAPDPKFTATLLPANETTAVVGGDVSGSGTVSITMHPTKDAAGNVTAATADFTVTLSGFPAGTTITGSHIHPGATGVAGGVIWPLPITAGEIVFSGSTTYTKLGVAVPDAANAQGILNNPAGFYFNVHTSTNGGGAARGQLVRAN
jgi:hypothetical protein